MRYQALGVNAERREQEAAARDARIQRERDLRAEERARIAEHQRKYRAEVRRQNDKWEFEQFLKAQEKRIARRLQQSAERVTRARWRLAADGDDLVLVRHQQ